MKIRPQFNIREPYVGARYDEATRTFHVMIVPCVGLRVMLDPIRQGQVIPPEVGSRYQEAASQWRGLFKHELDRLKIAAQLGCSVTYNPTGADAVRGMITDLLDTHEKQARMLDGAVLFEHIRRGDDVR